MELLLLCSVPGEYPGHTQLESCMSSGAVFCQQLGVHSEKRLTFLTSVVGQHRLLFLHKCHTQLMYLYVCISNI